MAEYSSDPSGTPTVKLIEKDVSTPVDNVVVEIPGDYDIQVFSNGTVRWFHGPNMVSEINPLKKVWNPGNLAGYVVEVTDNLDEYAKGRNL